MSSATGRQEEAQGMQAGSPLLDIFEPRPVLSGGLEAVLGQEAESLGSMSGAPSRLHLAARVWGAGVGGCLSPY